MLVFIKARSFRSLTSCNFPCSSVSHPMLAIKAGLFGWILMALHRAKRGAFLMEARAK
tara:strand:- start:62 stop:235 length:174 start_codon:yes stop_codon:yes gene_type:complete